MEGLLEPRISWATVRVQGGQAHPGREALGFLSAHLDTLDPGGSRCPHWGEYFQLRAAGVYGKIMEEEGGKAGQQVREGGASV